MKTLVFRTADDSKSGPDSRRFTVVREGGSIPLDINGNPQAWPVDTVTEDWQYVAAATNPPTLRNAALHFILNTGVGTPTSTMSTKGGMRMTTTNSSADVCNIKATTASPFATRGVVYSPKSRLRFQTQINPAALTEQIILGMAQAPHATALDVTSQGTDLVFFIFDPGNSVSSGIATYATNWIACAKAASGTAEYFDTGVAAQAGADVELTFEFDSLLRPVWSINGTVVATGTAWTVLVALLACIGIKTTTAAAKTMDVRYVRVGRTVG